MPTDASSAQQTVRDLRRGFRELVHRYPEAKAKAKEATNSDAWGPTPDQKLELVKIACNHSDDRELIYKALFKRMDETSSYWMHNTKSLDVLEYFLFLEVPDVVPHLNTHRDKLERLTAYSAAENEDSVRQQQLNTNVRAKAARMLRLIDDADFLSEESQKVLTMMTRMGASTGSRGGSPVPNQPTRPAASAPSHGDVYADSDDEDDAGRSRSKSTEKGAFVQHSATAHRNVAVAAQSYQVQPTRQSPSPQVASPIMSHGGRVSGGGGSSTDLFSQPLHTTAPAAPQQQQLFGHNTIASTAQQPSVFQPTPVYASAPVAVNSTPPHYRSSGTEAAVVSSGFSSTPSQWQPQQTQPQQAQQQAHRPTQAQGFDPFAELNQVQQEQQASRQKPAQSAADFFTTPGSATQSFVPSPAPQPHGPSSSTGASSRASPVPTGDRMTDAMMAQLEGYQGKKTGPKGDTQTLGDLMRHHGP